MSDAIVEHSGACLARDVEVARTPWTRLRGLLGRDAISPGSALLIEPCSSIHTIGMRFPIDVLFLDRKGRVLRLEHSMPPGRMVPWVWKAHRVLELPAGTLADATVSRGDTVTVGDEGRC